MLDEGRIRPDAMPLAIAASRRICARCDGSGDFNHRIDDAREQGRVPERWHPARLLDGGLLCGTRAAPPLPSSYLVAASDGSQIYPDAHQIADCYLLHISGIALRYGDVTNPDAGFRSIGDATPRMSTHAASESQSDNALMRATPYFGHGASDDVWQAALRAASIASNREMVDARRHVAELEELARLLDSTPPEIPAVGLCDGIFDLRVSSQQPWRELAQQENHRALDALRLCRQPIGGYIAASRATDVVTSLRLVLRELARENGTEIDDQSSVRQRHDDATTSENNTDNTGVASRSLATSDINELFNSEVDEALAILTDARLFDGLLQLGERSAIFEAGRGANKSSRGMSTSGSTHAGEGARHQTCFFYFKSGAGDVARLEFPVWVAQNAEWLDRLHAVVLAQIERGNGYPVALMEAHEHAVVRGSERELFYQLLEEMMAARGLNPHRSNKALSKSRPLV